MKAYFKIFVNWKQNHFTKLLPITDFIYNNTKIASTGHILFELYCSCHPKVFFKENVDFRSRSCSTDKLAKELREIMKVCYQNLLYAQELEKKAC